MENEKSKILWLKYHFINIGRVAKDKLNTMLIIINKWLVLNIKIGITTMEQPVMIDQQKRKLYIYWTEEKIFMMVMSMI